MLSIPACCGAVAAGAFPTTSYGAPTVNATFAAAAAFGSGLAAVRDMNEEPGEADSANYAVLRNGSATLHLGLERDIHADHEGGLSVDLARDQRRRVDPRVGRGHTVQSAHGSESRFQIVDGQVRRPLVSPARRMHLHVTGERPRQCVDRLVALQVAQFESVVIRSLVGGSGALSKTSPKFAVPFR